MGTGQHYSGAQVPSDQFVFTITDLARFLGKSPVTLRGWERKGEISFPRNDAGQRTLMVDDIKKSATFALERKRISRTRYDYITAACTLLTLIEET